MIIKFAIFKEILRRVVADCENEEANCDFQHIDLVYDLYTHSHHSSHFILPFLTFLNLLDLLDLGVIITRPGLEGTTGNHWWWTGLRKNEEGWRWGSGQGFILEVLCISNMCLCLWFFFAGKAGGACVWYLGRWKKESSNLWI